MKKKTQKGYNKYDLDTMKGRGMLQIEVYDIFFFEMCFSKIFVDVCSKQHQK